MKTVKELKVGDIAFDLRYGNVKVVDVKHSHVYNDWPIMVEVEDGRALITYTREGKVLTSHKYPVLYSSNPFTANQGKWMMVSTDNCTWKKRFVFTKKCGKYIAWCYAETDEEVIDSTSVNSWNYAKEIEEETIPEYTMKELVEKLGNFKIKK